MATKNIRTFVNRLARAIKPADESSILRNAEATHSQRWGQLSLRRLLSMVSSLITILRDPTYKLSWQTRSLVLAALVYFALPTDLTPDYIPVVGFIDDSAVLMLVVKRLTAEVDRFHSQQHPK